MSKSYKFMIVAGEASGDLHGAKLVRALRAEDPGARFDFFGSAGPALRNAGVEAVVRADGLSIVGLPEIAKALPMFLRAFRDLRNAAVTQQPDAVILVDFPDFNLKLARSLKKKGITVVYYISPQLWAWRKYRIRTIRKYVDLLITILPFEKDWYSVEGVTHVEYVGSPLAREVHTSSSKNEFCGRHGIDAKRHIVSLLPGSRHKEIVKILPVLLETAANMAERDRSIQFIIPISSGRNEADVRARLADFTSAGRVLPETLLVVKGETYDALYASDAAAVTSGTATLETGILGTPMAIVYRTSTFNYKLLRPLISVEHFGLINLIAGERVAKELIQDEFTPQTLSDELFRLLEPAENKRVRQKLTEAADKLGHGGASKRAAEAIMRLIVR